MSQLLEAQVFGGEQSRDLGSAAGSFFWPQYEAAACYGSLWSNSSCESLPILFGGNESCCLSDPSMSCEPIDSVMKGEEIAASFFYPDFCYQHEELLIPNEANDNNFTEYNAASEHTLQAKEGVLQTCKASLASVHAHTSKKKARASCESMKKEPSKKKPKCSSEDASNAVLNIQASSSCSSEENGSNASQEFNEGLSGSSSSKGCAEGKARAGRGAATDPQSLYARVDISTMLEEAVQYVKFLQLQIKLLSSDELWMYAPIAYNGLNIGLDLILPSNSQ
ncbi:hypothetical protein HPP92_023311 [Vanilla planifolia]|uniref:Uncharacterized protein n=1 Tax=Vanilla planifolia TaxID=51239 RepID=A0A835PWC9_VANPL|nr:hypothetical protein HPP92_023311 [Vanilla planifolia]